MTKDKLTVQAIKDYLKQDLSAIDTDLVASWRLDQRQGVIKALSQYDRRLTKESERQEHIRYMNQIEADLHAKGFQYIAGVDEVGRGPLAGPVVTAAVILKPKRPLFDLRDSKQLSQVQRQNLIPLIKENSVAIAINVQDNEAIDRYNILNATKRSMMNSIRKLSPQAEYVLIDAVDLSLDIPHSSLIKGDDRVSAIAAASIIAKEYRDQIMRDYAKQYPAYGFDRNVGYGTKEHLKAIETYGPCPIHRRSFAPIKDYF